METVWAPITNPVLALEMIKTLKSRCVDHWTLEMPERMVTFLGNCALHPMPVLDDFQFYRAGLGLRRCERWSWGRWISFPSQAGHRQWHTRICRRDRTKNPRRIMVQKIRLAARRTIQHSWRCRYWVIVFSPPRRSLWSARPPAEPSDQGIAHQDAGRCARHPDCAAYA